MATFVLVPGAWLGAWAWRDAVLALAEHGHTARPLTLSGLAERSGEGGPWTDLETHVQDITDAVERDDLRDVTLVVHSYAAAPGTGAAARLGDRLARVVYLDSAPFAEGLRMLDLMPPDVADQLSRQVADHGDAWRLAMPPVEILGRSSSIEGLDDARREQLRTRATPQPFGTYTQRLAGPVDLPSGVDRVLLACHDMQGLLGAGLPMLAHLAHAPWRRVDLDTGHWPMLSVPGRLADVLHTVVARAAN